MRYFHRIDKTSGLSGLQDDACKLLDFSRLNLEAGGRYEGRLSAEREAVLVVLSGSANLEVNGVRFDNVGGRPDVFSGNPHSVYLPRGASFLVEAASAMEAALPSAPAFEEYAPYQVLPGEVDTGTWGTLNFTRYFRKIVVHGDGRPASRIIVGETITPSGNWSTFPPHKHEVAEGGEVFHEEMYYFRNSSPDGYGLVQHYSPERGYDNTYRVEDDTLLSMPHGYHTYAAAPGSASYYLWFLAGDGREQGTSFDPRVGWVQKTVGMV
ncbi:MAG: 5-deoxy-glucuronate isomerase [Trueperaceae bacterium]